MAGDAPALDLERLAAPMRGRLAALEPLAATHEDALYDAARFREIWDWFPMDPAADRDAFARWSAQWREELARREIIRFATLDARTGAVLGSTSYLHIEPENRGVEIGWTWLTPAAWDTGVNADAKLQMLKQAFAAGAIRVAFLTDARNERSRRALAAIPAQFEGILRDHRIIAGDGRRRSSAVFSVLDSEWPAVEAALEQRVARRAVGAASPAPG
jgi:N-acetyltransferase